MIPRNCRRHQFSNPFDAPQSGYIAQGFAADQIALGRVLNWAQAAK